jgi:hypothetical protein
MRLRMGTASHISLLSLEGEFANGLCTIRVQPYKQSGQVRARQNIVKGLSVPNERTTP